MLRRSETDKLLKMGVIGSAESADGVQVCMTELTTHPGMSLERSVLLESVSI